MPISQLFFSIVYFYFQPYRAAINQGIKVFSRRRQLLMVLSASYRTGYIDEAVKLISTLLQVVFCRFKALSKRLS